MYDIKSVITTGSNFINCLKSPKHRLEGMSVIAYPMYGVFEQKLNLNLN